MVPLIERIGGRPAVVALTLQVFIAATAAGPQQCVCTAALAHTVIC